MYAVPYSPFPPIFHDLLANENGKGKFIQLEPTRKESRTAKSLSMVNPHRNASPLFDREKHDGKSMLLKEECGGIREVRDGRRGDLLEASGHNI